MQTLSLNQNIFDIRKIGHLQRVAYYIDMKPGHTYYAAPGSCDGVPKYAWLTEFEYVGLIDTHTIVGKCTIMDGNYSFTRIFSDKDTVIYYA